MRDSYESEIEGVLDKYLFSYKGRDSHSLLIKKSEDEYSINLSNLIYSSQIKGNKYIKEIDNYSDLYNIIIGDL